MTCTICPNYGFCPPIEDGDICPCWENTPRDTHEIFTRRLRLCSITGKYDYVGSDGMTKAERERHEEIKKIWQESKNQSN